MRRWNELVYNFGFKILFPRLCLYGLVPALILLGPDNMAWLAYWSPAFDRSVLVLFGSLLMLNLMANLAISRYLRLNQSAASAYEYSGENNCLVYTPYFRVQIKDCDAFRRLIKSVRAEHRGEAIWVWFWLDDLWLVPTILISAVWLLWTVPLWLVRRFRVRQQPAPL